jgi:enoyl-ACP reductase-like protein
VRCNAFSLGVIQNPAFDPASYEGLGELHPLGRVGQISDVVEGILYLERAPFVTGVVLHIDDGWSVRGGLISPTGLAHENQVPIAALEVGSRTPDPLQNFADRSVVFRGWSTLPKV